MANCKFLYIEKQNISESEKSRLTEAHINIFQRAVDSKAFRRFNNKLYSLKNNIQAAYNFVSSINTEYNAKVASIQTSQPGQHFLSVNVLDLSKEKQGVLFANVEDSNEINYSLRIIDLLNSNKVREPSKNFQGFLNDLKGASSQQIQLLKDTYTEGMSKGELISSLLANYSYTVEINTAKHRKEEFENDYAGKPNKIEENVNTQHYSNLTVPGGTNYTENEISTPLITPSIKGHAAFSTDSGIGWFRSDEKQNYTEQDIDFLIDNMIKSGILQKNCS